MQGANLNLGQILNSNCVMVSGMIYFLTLQCSDGLFYEAKIYMPITGDCQLFIFRPAKYWPWPRYYYSKTKQVQGQLSFIFQSQVLDDVPSFAFCIVLHWLVTKKCSVFCVCVFSARITLFLFEWHGTCLSNKKSIVYTFLVFITHPCEVESCLESTIITSFYNICGLL